MKVGEAAAVHSKWQNRPSKYHDPQKVIIQSLIEKKCLIKERADA